MKRPRALPLRARVPWYWRLAAARIRAGQRGGYALLSALERLGLLEQCAPFPLAGGSVQLPLFTTGLTNPELLAIYERDALQAMAAASRRMTTAPLLVDCGADVGVYARLYLAHGGVASEIVALEPNPRSHAVLVHNLRALDLPVRALRAGAGEHAGRGALCEPDYDASERAFFVQPGAGDLILHTVDELVGARSDRPLALKVDVEGLELAVLRGARQALIAAAQFTVQFEAHPAVAARSGVDPIACLDLLVALGADRWVVCEEGAPAPDVQLQPGQAFFTQLPDGHIYDVVASKGV